uniref:Uncharacterized protein n=1 Tax=Cucumis melo TaxID=3656 RepID=A0A9I9ECU6_CUCME
MVRRPIALLEIKAKGDFMAMGGSFEKKRMKMNASMADQNAQNALTHLKNYLSGNVDLGTACGKYYRVSCLSIIIQALKVVLSLLLQIPALQNPFSFKGLLFSLFIQIVQTFTITIFVY